MRRNRDEPVEGDGRPEIYTLRFPDLTPSGGPVGTWTNVLVTVTIPKVEVTCMEDYPRQVWIDGLIECHFTASTYTIELWEWWTANLWANLPDLYVRMTGGRIRIIVTRFFSLDNSNVHNIEGSMYPEFDILEPKLLTGAVDITIPTVDGVVVDDDD